MPLSNAQLKILRRLHTRQGRRKSEYFVSEGWRVCREALQAKPEWIEFVVVSSEADIDCRSELEAASVSLHEVAPADFAEFAQTETPQGILAVMRRPESSALAAGALLYLVLDRVADPGNFGAILRSCQAAGLKQVAYTSGTTDPWGAKAIRAGMGAQFRVDLCAFGNLEDAQRWFGANGSFDFWLTSPHAGTDCFSDDFALERAVIVMGNEAAGPGELAGARYVSIPMPGTAESLNVAHATTVLLFEAVRRGVL
jgi:TrmH family RNA methyltransferase